MRREDGLRFPFPPWPVRSPKGFAVAKKRNKLKRPKPRDPAYDYERECWRYDVLLKELRQAAAEWNLAIQQHIGRSPPPNVTLNLTFDNYQKRCLLAWIVAP